MNLVEGSSVKVVDLARVPEGIAYPSYKKLTLIGCVIGVGLTLAIIVLLVLFNSYIEDEDDTAKRLRCSRRRQDTEFYSL